MTQGVEYGITTVPLPYSGSLSPPSQDVEWELVSTQVAEVSRSENIPAVMPGCFQCNTTSFMRELICTWKSFKCIDPQGEGARSW